MIVPGVERWRVVISSERTRNSNLYVDDEEVDDLVRALEGQLAASRYGAAVRLEITKECPQDLCDFLRDHFSLDQADIFLLMDPSI